MSYSADVVLLSAAGPVQLGRLTLRSIVPMGAPKVRQFKKNGYISVISRTWTDCVQISQDGSRKTAKM